MQAGQAVGQHLGSRTRGGFGGSLGFGGGLGLGGSLGGSPGFGSGNPGGKILLRRGGQRGLGAGNDQYLLQLREISRGLDADGGVGLVIGIRSDGLDRADRQGGRGDPVGG